MITKFPVPKKGAKILLIKIKSYNILFHVLLVCIRTYLKSSLRYKYLILDTHHQETIFVCKSMLSNHGYFS